MQHPLKKRVPRQGTQERRYLRRIEELEHRIATLEAATMVRATPPDVRDLRSLIERVAKEPHLVLDAEWRAEALRLGCQPLKKWRDR